MCGQQNSQGFAIWMTGMSGAGKTTLGERLKEEFKDRSLKVEMLDGDVVRQALGKDLGFTREDRIVNLERAAFVASLLVKHGVIVICSFISPYEVCRQHARENIDRCLDVYVKCPLEILIERDTKGLYKKALSGEIKNFTGLSDPFDEPDDPDICVETHKESIEESFDKIIDFLEGHQYIPKASARLSSLVRESANI